MLVLCSCQNDELAKEQIPAIEPYAEKHRPQLHFSPPSNWMNDPNGMVFFEDEYHLFYQHYPDSNVWGPMHWGHAVSEDLVHWENLPIALYPDELGYIFSGSAVIDWNNTSGFGKEDEPPMVAIFTHHDAVRAATGKELFQVQSLAFSTDKGRSWNKYANNPIIDNPGLVDFRDPKVFWHEETAKWIMVLAAKDRLKIYHSPNLISWTFASDFGAQDGNHDGVWECPDLFPLTTAKGDEKWVLLQSINQGGPNGGSATQYFVGDFDGETFTNDHGPQVQLWVDWGKDNYAGVTFSDIPKSDGRRLFIGWMSNWEYAQVVPTEVWRSAMTLPRKLGLIQTDAGFRLTADPIRELRRLRAGAVTISRRPINEDVDLLRNIHDRTGLYEIHLEIFKPQAGQIKLELVNDQGEFIQVGYDADQNEYFTDRLSSGQSGFSEKFSGRHFAPCYYDESIIKMTLMIDHSSMELFADDGKIVMTEIYFPTTPFNDIKLLASNPLSEMKRARIYSLKGIWK